MLERVSCGREQELPHPSNRDYEYEFPFKKETPPFPAEALLHFFYNPSCAATCRSALTSFPKKLNEEVDDVSWGLHACERLSGARVLGTGMLAFAPTLIFIPYWLAKHPGDIQNAFTPSLAVLALVVFWFEVYVHCIAPKGMA